MEFSLRNASYLRNNCRVIGVHYSRPVFRAWIIKKWINYVPFISATESKF